MSILAKAKAAHDAHVKSIADEQMERCNTMLKTKLKEIFGIDADPTDNRYTDADDNVTLMVHDNGNMHVLSKCSKCGFEYRSLTVVTSLPSLYEASKEPERGHPPCNGAVPLNAVSEKIELTPDQVIQQ